MPRDADGAVALLESRSDIALLFTDIDMPGSMDGLKLAHAVRDRWPPIKILLVVRPGPTSAFGTAFLSGFAGLLGVAIEGQHADAGLEEALKHQALLTREMSHRLLAISAKTGTGSSKWRGIGWQENAFKTVGSSW